MAGHKALLFICRAHIAKLIERFFVFLYQDRIDPMRDGRHQQNKNGQGTCRLNYYYK